MNYELPVHVGNHDYTAFLQDGFYAFHTRVSPLHNHNYAEIHVVSNASARFIIGDSVYSAQDGNVILIPHGIFHRLDSSDANTLHTAFQIDYPAETFSACTLDKHTILAFFHEIERCSPSQDYTVISAYISLLCSYFPLHMALNAQPIVDSGFLIHEFISQHYREDLQLSDLANALHLSLRQTERLVVAQTGNTFREELTAVRINIAKHLIKTTDMSLGEIARYVGYRSYAGFWKAIKKHDCLLP